MAPLTESDFTALDARDAAKGVKDAWDRKTERRARGDVEAEFEAMEKAHVAMIDQLKAVAEKIEDTKRTLNLIAGAFVDNDYVRHRIGQIAEFEREDSHKRLKQYLIQGVALSAVLSLVIFVGAAVLTRFATVTLPTAVQGVTK
jgi:hypothetical protein